MITFRYHIVSIVSVFLALAVGVALGGGPLKGEVDNTLVEQVEADRRTKNALQTEIAGLRDTDVFSDTFARTVAPQLIENDLDGRVVNLVVLPGAVDSSVSSVSELLTGAGATVGGTVRIGEEFVDVSNKQLVDELASQLLDGANDVTVDEAAGGYERMGALVARAIGTTADGGESVDATADSILSGLSTAGLMSPDGELDRRGSLILFVAGEGSGSSEERQGATSILASLASAIDANTDGVVIGGPVASAREGGLIAAVRSDVGVARGISTVDVFGRTAGQVVSILALDEQAAGEAGHYGAIDAPDGAMPGAVPPSE